MELSSEDSLRLNVLLAQALQAVRIDESRMVVYALSDKGEAKVHLNPNCKDELYLRRVRQLFSSHILGSPGGYPLYLRRWTRMGQARDESLEKLLLLGEPEAVIAVVHAQGLTDELARRAWWAEPLAENARRMLERECVAQGRIGPVLAEYLLEFLPFEEGQQPVMDSIRLMLQRGLISDQQKKQLWDKARRKNTYYVGFLEALPDDLPVERAAHPESEEANLHLQPLVDSENQYAMQLCRIFSAAGQAFLDTAETVFQKPVNQDVVVALLEAIGAYFASIRMEGARPRDIETIEAKVQRLLDGHDARSPGLEEILTKAPRWREIVRAMLVLSLYSEQLVVPIFGLTDAIGSVMRKRIEPITDFTMKQFSTLRCL